MDPRNDDVLRQDLSHHLPPSVRMVLFNSIDAAYRDAGGQFDPDRGCDMQWFGFTIFKFVSHRIRTASQTDLKLGISVLSGTTGAFRFRAGPFVVAPYSCGYQAPADPWNQFPRNDHGAGLLSDINTGELDLFPDFQESLSTGIVLGHYGNPEAGLEALYLKLPTNQMNGRICKWGYVEPLYQAGGAKAGPAKNEPRSPVLPGPAKVTRPIVLPFKKKPAPDSETEGA